MSKGPNFIQRKYLILLTLLCIICTDYGVRFLTGHFYGLAAFCLLGTLPLYLLAMHCEAKTIREIKMRNSADNLAGISELRKSVDSLLKAAIELSIIVTISVIISNGSLAVARVISTFIVLTFLLVFVWESKFIYEREIDALKPKI